MPTLFSGTENPRPLLIVTRRYALYALLIFAPLALASVQDWAMSVIEMVTLVALTAFLFEKSMTWNWKWIKTPLDKPIIVLLILSSLSAVFSMNRPRSFWAILLLINYVIIFYLIVSTVRTRSDYRHLIWVIISVGAFLSLFGLFKKYMGNPFPWWNYHNIPETAGHLISTYGNRNHLTGYLEMALPLSLGLILTGYRGVRLFLLVVLSALLLLVLILAFSRGGWVSASLGLIFMGFVLMTSQYFNKKKILVAIIGGGVVLMMIVLSNTAMVERLLTIGEVDIGSSAGRIKIWSAAVEMIEDHPVLGIGPGNFSTVFTQYLPPAENRHFYAHNDYIQSAAEIGLAAIVIIAWMIAAIYRRGFKKLKNQSRLVWGITIGALSGITAILVHSIFDFNLHIPANALLFTVLVALAVSPLPVDNQ